MPKVLKTAAGGGKGKKKVNKNFNILIVEVVKD
jgi:hypothetical protein